MYNPNVTRTMKVVARVLPPTSTRDMAALRYSNGSDVKKKCSSRVAKLNKEEFVRRVKEDVIR